MTRRTVWIKVVNQSITALTYNAELNNIRKSKISDTEFITQLILHALIIFYVAYAKLYDTSNEGIETDKIAFGFWISRLKTINLSYNIHGVFNYFSGYSMWEDRSTSITHGSML